MQTTTTTTAAGRKPSGSSVTCKSQRKSEDANTPDGSRRSANDKRLALAIIAAGRKPSGSSAICKSRLQFDANTPDGSRRSANDKRLGLAIIAAGRKPSSSSATCKSRLQFDANTPDGSRRSASVRRNAAAFSLVELMVVIVIIGILSALVAVQTRSFLIASKQNAARAEIATIVSALETFYADQSRYPTNDEGIAILVEGTTSFPDGFLKKVPLDPWKHPYEFVSPGAKSPFEVLCLGADGREGGEGENADISSEALDAK